MSGGRSSRITSARRDFVGEVHQVVSSSFAGRYPNIQLVAGAIGMSTRTLQRRLGEDGVTYAQVVARARAEMARQMLRDSAWKIGEIGRTIGYSNAGHFTRALFISITEGDCQGQARDRRRGKGTRRLDGIGSCVDDLCFARRNAKGGLQIWYSPR